MINEDLIKQDLSGIHQEVKVLRDEGNKRGEKIDGLVVKVSKGEVRLDNLEHKNAAHVLEHKDINRKMDHIEKRIYQLGCAILLVAGGIDGVCDLLSSLF